MGLGEGVTTVMGLTAVAVEGIGVGGIGVAFGGRFSFLDNRRCSSRTTASLKEVNDIGVSGVSIFERVVTKALYSGRRLLIICHLTF